MCRARAVQGGVAAPAHMRAHAHDRPVSHGGLVCQGGRRALLLRRCVCVCSPVPGRLLARAWDLWCLVSVVGGGSPLAALLEMAVAASVTGAAMALGAMAMVTAAAMPAAMWVALVLHYKKADLEMHEGFSRAADIEVAEDSEEPPAKKLRL